MIGSDSISAAVVAATVAGGAASTAEGATGGAEAVSIVTGAPVHECTR